MFLVVVLILKLILKLRFPTDVLNFLLAKHRYYIIITFKMLSHSSVHEKETVSHCGQFISVKVKKKERACHSMYVYHNVYAHDFHIASEFHTIFLPRRKSA